jgi:ankyrin repeat protein
MRLFLDNGANVNKISSRSGRAAIHQAVATNNISTMRLLIMHGANINTKTKKPINYEGSLTAGMTPLDFALATKNKKAVSMLQRAGGLTAQQLQQKENVE